MIRANYFLFSFLNSKKRLRSCCNWRSKSTADVRVKNRNPQLTFIQTCFLVSILLKQRKNQHPRRTTNKIWQMTSLRLKFFGNTKCKHSSKRSWNLMLMELKQVKIPVSLQLCKEISFVIFIFCALWKIIFWTWESWKKHNRLLPPKTGEHLLFLHHNLWKPE